MRLWDNDADGARTGADYDDSQAAERLKEAFGLLRAPAVTYERIYKMAQNDGTATKGGWTRKVTVRAAVVGAAVAMLIASGAYAAVSSDFFSSAFGDKGQDDVAAHEVVDEAKRLAGVEPIPWTAPAMEWVAVDPAEAERIVGDTLATVGESVTLGDVTLTVESCAMDENGLGVATFVVSDPNGVSIGDAGYGQFYFDPEGLVSDLGVTGGDDVVYDWRYVLDKGLSTETEVHGVLYFGPFGLGLDGEKGLEPLKFSLVGVDDSSVSTAPAAIGFTPSGAMGAADFAADGIRASLSPIGIVLEGDAVEDAWLESLTVRFDDGSDFVVESNEVLNAVVGWYAAEHTTVYMFNRLIDPSEVVSVEAVLAQTGESLELLPTE